MYASSSAARTSVRLPIRVGRILPARISRSTVRRETRSRFAASSSVSSSVTVVPAGELAAVDGAADGALVYVEGGGDLREGDGTGHFAASSSGSSDLGSRTTT